MTPNCVLHETSNDHRQKLKMTVLEVEQNQVTSGFWVNLGWIQETWHRVLFSAAPTKRFEFITTWIGPFDWLQRPRFMGIVRFEPSKIKYSVFGLLHSIDI